MIVFVLGLGALALYLMACAWRPFGACRKCSGAGRFSSRSKKHWRNCPRCGGSGKRLRLGRQLTGRW